MRYYSIILQDSSGNLVTTPSSVPNSGATYTSFANNKTIPAALNIELNIPVADFAAPSGDAFVRIWGISLQEILKAKNFVGNTILVFGGYQLGLPLAKPSQAGQIMFGTVKQAFGNWIGKDMTLDLICGPYVGTALQPKNITLAWKKGTQLSQAIQQMLNTAFPGSPVTMQISSNLVFTQDVTGFYDSLQQLNAWVLDQSRSIIGTSITNYRGVRILPQQKASKLSFLVYDGSNQPNNITQINFEDMIGQPTWIGTFAVQVKFNMRADLALSDLISFPAALTTQTQAGAPPLGSNVNQTSIFQSGQWMITYMQHYGNYRQPDAASWNTTVNVAAISGF